MNAPLPLPPWEGRSPWEQRRGPPRHQPPPTFNIWIHPSHYYLEKADLPESRGGDPLVIIICRSSNVKKGPLNLTLNFLTAASLAYKYNFSSFLFSVFLIISNFPPFLHLHFNLLLMLDSSFWLRFFIFTVQHEYILRKQISDQDYFLTDRRTWWIDGKLHLWKTNRFF